VTRENINNEILNINKALRLLKHDIKSKEHDQLRRDAAAALARIAKSNPEKIESVRFLVGTAKTKLVSYLEDRDHAVRQEIRKALDYLQWKPENQNEKIYYSVWPEMIGMLLWLTDAQKLGMPKNVCIEISVGDFVRFIIPHSLLSRLFGHYTDIILDLTTWRSNENPDDFLMPNYDLSTCNQAIGQLQEAKTPVADLILARIGKISAIGIETLKEDNNVKHRYIPFDTQREAVNKFIESRGAPKPGPELFLNDQAWNV
jgi:hypothetical protein